MGVSVYANRNGNRLRPLAAWACVLLLLIGPVVPDASSQGQESSLAVSATVVPGCAAMSAVSSYLQPDVIASLSFQCGDAAPFLMEAGIRETLGGAIRPLTVVRDANVSNHDLYVSNVGQREIFVQKNQVLFSSVSSQDTVVITLTF